jgi:DNA uptake protein ComE-like DNA-binding protein
VRLSLSLLIHPETVLIADFSKVKLPETDKKQSVILNQLTSESSSLFVFNPNSVTKEQLIKLGFSSKVAGIFIKYRDKGAVFAKKEDIKKVYGVDEKLYQRIEPYILLEGKKETSRENNLLQKTSPLKKTVVIELNSADSSSLLPLPGIGSSYAKRIIKYRDLLGGYYAKEQLKEVFGFSDSLFMLIKDDVSVNKALLKKLNINSENFKELNAHPYISYEETKSIFNYRRKNGLIKSKDQLKEVLNSETFSKIEPYLDF